MSNVILRKIATECIYAHDADTGSSAKAFLKRLEAEQPSVFERFLRDAALVSATQFIGQIRSTIRNNKQYQKNVTDRASSSIHATLLKGRESVQNSPMTNWDAVAEWSWFVWLVPFANKTLGKCTQSDLTESAAQCLANSKTHRNNAEFLQTVAKYVTGKELVEDKLTVTRLQRYADQHNVTKGSSNE